MRLILISLALSPWLLPGQEPAAQKPAQTQGAPAPASPTPNKTSGEYATGDGVFSVELFGWMTSPSPHLRAGRAHAGTNSSDLDFSSDRFPMPGIRVSIPAGAENTVRISYFRAQRSEQVIVNQNSTIFSAAFVPGDLLDTKYTIQSAKISYDFLSWPWPVHERFRLKTLWEVQFSQIAGKINAPLKATTDSNGNTTQVDGQQTRNVIYPTFGLGVEYSLNKHVRWEAVGSGFAIPTRATLWDTHTALAMRFGALEALAGVQAHHFKTSPRREDYFSSTMAGPYVGLRYYFR